MVNSCHMIVICRVSSFSKGRSDIADYSTMRDVPSLKNIQLLLLGLLFNSTQLITKISFFSFPTECGRQVLNQLGRIPINKEQWSPAAATDSGILLKSSPNWQAANGHIAMKGSSPWIAQIWHTKFVEMICAGVLINHQWVLTAAHCVQTTNATAPTIRIQLGDHDLELPEVGQRTYNVREIIVHENFNSETFDSDIALLKVDGTVEYTNYVIPSCLSKIQDHEYELFNSGVLGKVVGWGKVSENGPYPRFLNEVKLPIVPQKICRESTSYTVTDNMFCAGSGRFMGPDACKGDSGAPFVINDGDKAYLIGLVSWGEGCGKEGKYGFYTRVGNYLNWLRQKIDSL
ncbi:coagulation factor IX-like [Anneissia japonica]|uniref:coagulation factor IX-like n=1 Tax=Anneissia japonica TaxID=1529436 RepID=UPI001425ABD0|nr:coagulation factor IX-like [Anneissia japonica]